MKETYKKPVSEVEEFDTVDVLTTSTGGTQQGGGGWD
jgi:hypothetical protein